MSIKEFQAARWVGVLDGEESAADREAFQRWLADPEHSAAHEEMERFWQDDLGALAGIPEFEERVAQVLAETAPGVARTHRSPYVWAMAASVVVGIFAAGAFIAGRYYVPTQTYVTESGQRSTIELDDGSQITLNAATRLSVKFTDERREFKLKEGEAVFTVAAEGRPFTVRAGDGKVTALGTRFQVRNELKRVTVTLLEGRIAVDRADHDQHLQLNPGEQVKFATTQAKLMQRTVDIGSAASWTTGYLEFKVTALAEVLDEVNRYSKVKLRLRDPSLDWATARRWCQRLS
jgi:transmembrane sensor